MKRTWLFLLSVLLLVYGTNVTALAGGGLFDSDYSGGWDDGDYSNSTSDIYGGERPEDMFTEGYRPEGEDTGSSYGSEDYGSYIPDAYEDNSSSDFTPIPIIVPVGEEGTVPPIGTLPEGEYDGEVLIKSAGTQSLDWYGVGFDLVNENKNFKVRDLNTGITWNATYVNGSNHADVIPSTASDAQLLSANDITGSYVRRPVVVTIGGTQYAGSMYAVGHGSTSYCKHFKGVMCIHFTGSQTHGSKKVDKDHQAAIQDALTYGSGN